MIRGEVGKPGIGIRGGCGSRLLLRIGVGSLGGGSDYDLGAAVRRRVALFCVLRQYGSGVISLLSAGKLESESRGTITHCV